VQEFELVVIGGGSAGLKAARTAARAGHTVAVAEEAELGGECFWAGCVPTKAMVRAAQVWQLVRNAGKFGIHADVREANFADAMQYRYNVQRELGGEPGSDAGLSKLGAAYFPTHAQFEDSHHVRVGSEVVRGEQIIVAAGTIPAVPSIPGLKESGFITNREAVHLKHLPRRIAILGAGPIGLEFAQIFQRFGAEVTVLEYREQVLFREDPEIAKLAQTFLETEGIRILTGVMATHIEKVADEKRITVSGGNALATTVACDEILVAIGRQADFDGLQIGAADIDHDERRLTVDRHLRTSQPHIWAAGDVCSCYQFTHVAAYEGKLAALNAYADNPRPFNHRVVPRCTYIDPEVASIGLTEQEAQDAQFTTRVVTSSFADLDRAILHGDSRGLVKLVIEEMTGLVLGAHVIGQDASSIIAEIAICMQNHVPVSAIADTMHAYPSFPEAVESAALAF
jgi:pyruvate/2-oxoglutarate dehydrogenase complex dihydrolipoamide dehydrogenase (E3) component